jgi:hypothetical protein
MKPYRILGIGWMGLCVSSGVLFFFEFRYLRWLHEGQFTGDVFWCVCDLMVCLAGIVASAFLPRGVGWARAIIALVAFWDAMYCGLAIEFDGPPHWVVALLGLTIFYSWISIILLLIPKKYFAPASQQRRPD